MNKWTTLAVGLNIYDPVKQIEKSGGREKSGRGADAPRPI